MQQFGIVIPEFLVRIHHLLKLCARGVAQQRGTGVVRSFKRPALCKATKKQCQTNYVSTEHLLPHLAAKTVSLLDRFSFVPVHPDDLNHPIHPKVLQG
jgi:hypothetical protein